MVVLEEGSGVTAAHTPSDWLESDEFEPMPSDPIFMSADKFSKTPPAGTLSRVGSGPSHRPVISSYHTQEDNTQGNKTDGRSVWWKQ